MIVQRFAGSIVEFSRNGVELGQDHIAGPTLHQCCDEAAAAAADVDQVLRAFDEGLALSSEDVDEEPKTPSLARTEWEHINRVLTDTGGNISETARRLGLQRRTLQRKLKCPPHD